MLKPWETQNIISDIIEEINSESQPAENNSGDNDDLLPQAISLVGRFRAGLQFH